MGDRMGEGETPLERMREQSQSERVRVTAHAQQEMAADAFVLDDVLYAIQNGQILEDYPEYRRGACCLLGGTTDSGRPVHVVCSTAQPLLIIITVYEPKPPKWVTPTQRRPTNEMQP